MKFPRVELSAKSYTGEVLGMLIKSSVLMLPLGLWKAFDLAAMAWEAVCNLAGM